MKFICPEVDKEDLEENYPLELKLVIDSPDDLRHLWHLLNMAEKDMLEEGCEGSVSAPLEWCDCYDLWDPIDELCKDLGVK